jgi:PIN domain nuclease of toxin-antitoxin system
VKFLLDTCAILWMTLEPEKITAHARNVFQNPDHRFYLSVVSAWEIAIKDQIKRLDLPSPPAQFLSECITGYDLSVIDIQLRHTLHAGGLPPYHWDPFDRMIVSQAQLEGMSILTPDSAFSQYDVEVVW